MDAASPVFAALGVAGYDALNDLADWLDRGSEPTAGAEGSAWSGLVADYVHAAGWEG